MNPFRLRILLRRKVQPTVSGHTQENAGGLKLKELTKQAAMRTEEQLIRMALENFHGNVSAVARQMGITPRAVHQKLKKHAIDPRKFRDSYP